MRSFLIAVALCVAPVSATTLVPALAAPADVEALADQLKNGLRPRTPRENEFCDEVARLVRIGRLPVEVVDATYAWSLRRGRKYPFPAFEQALRLKAERLGLRLP